MAQVGEGVAQAREDIRHARIVVVKAGMPVVTHVNGDTAVGRVCAVIDQISRLRLEGRDVVLVTSGAISIGQVNMRRQLVLNSTLGDTVGSGPVMDVDRGAASSVGQSKLMSMYEALFSQYDISCGQVLVTEEDTMAAETWSSVCE